MALAFMRRHKKWLAVFLWLSIPALIVTFVALYIPTGDASTGGGDGVIAKVGGERITAGEYQRAYRRQRDQLQRMYQGRLDAAMMEQLGIREQTLQGLVEQKLVALEAARLGLSVDDETLARELRTSPGLQENGVFIGAAEIRRRLDQAGISEEEFQESMRADLIAQRLQSVVTDGVAMSPSEVEREYRRRNEQAKVEYVKVEARRGADPSDRRGGRRPLPGETRRLQVPRATRGVVRADRSARRCARGSRSPKAISTPTGATTRTSSGRPRRHAPATSW